ncbi:MAG TPA: transglycosylase SLT domain-containing protein [Burkholderiales bacterium]|nr:transglycosylase SLT domain-containing protein [Burkholderiales bacterium]
MKKLLSVFAWLSVLGLSPASSAQETTPAIQLPPSAKVDGSEPAPAPVTGSKVETPDAVATDAPIENMPVAAKPDSLWSRIRDGYALPQLDSQLVARHEAWFLNHPDYFQRMLERSRLYLYFIVEEVDKRKMPMEVALLPMIESAYNPVAYSRARAVGIWQFMPSTGKKYGLQQNWWYDGRRDVLAATRAALDYLEKLHGEFGDWQLALAAYNWGENGVNRAIAKNRAKRKPTDYMHLKMPKETRNYLPKLQAIRNIITKPELLSFPLEDIPNQPYFTTVSTPEHIDMEVAAQLAEMSVDELRSLNPGHTRPVIMSSGGNTLLLPVGKAAIFTANLKDYDKPLVSWQTYTLKNKETLDSVAAKFGLTAARLREINGLNRHIPVRPGRSLLVPMNTDGSASNLDETWKNPEFQAPEDYFGSRVEYRVKNGDSLYLIALRHRVTVAALKEWNHLSSNRLRIGQRLTIYSNPRHTARR